MAKKWTTDTVLLGSISDNLAELLPLFPKRMVRIDTLVREHGMPLSHVQILILLSGGVMSIGELSSRLNIAKPNITPLVDSLRAQGLVERVRDEGDRRIVNVHLLPAGEGKLQEIRTSIAQQVTEWPGEFSRSEMKELNSAMATIIRIVRSMDGAEK